MKRRTMVGALVAIFAMSLAVTARRCDIPAFTPTWFSYIPREQPRLFVSHHPLRAIPGQAIVIRLSPDLAGMTSVTRAVARVGSEGSDARVELACVASGAVFNCPHTLPTGIGTFVYDGILTLGDGNEVRSSAYRFRSVAAVGSNEVLALREPVAPDSEIAPGYLVKTVWVRDDGDGYAESTFLTDVEAAVYDGVLADPAYRWRDTQLGFYMYGSAGVTTSYYSGFDTRCGQNPWPAEATLRSTLTGVDVVAVMHRHPNTDGGVEGAVTSTNVFRDCAGSAVRRRDLTTFSAVGGVPFVAKHEFGHAAFGLGDEYSELDATRQVTAAQPLPDNQCCCVQEDGGPIGGGGITPGGGTVTPGGTSTTTGPGLTPRLARAVCAPGRNASPLLAGLSTCPDPMAFPAACSATPQAACPSLFGDCIRGGMWLGQPPGAGPQLRANVFPTEQACTAAITAARDHPGVEDAADGLDGACRQLCGSVVACPCGDPEAWIVDKHPGTPSAAAGNGSDAMGAAAPARHGSTCGRCIDASLCVRWERGRGRSADDAWSACEAPPADAAAHERGLIGLANAIAAWLAGVFGGWLDP